MDKALKELEIYVHVPFCVKKCNYCDFLSYSASVEAKEKYVDALLEEIRCADYKYNFDITYKDTRGVVHTKTVSADSEYEAEKKFRELTRDCVSITHIGKREILHVR